MKTINLASYLLDPKVWRYREGGYVHYTCHDHYNNPCYSDDTCGTCSGSRCCDAEGTYPRKYVEPDSFKLINEEVYGDTLVGFKEKINLGKLIDAIRNKEGYYEENGIEILIPDEISFPIPEYYHLSDTSKEFFNKLYELYQIINK